jgi:hypothetical protein
MADVTLLEADEFRTLCAQEHPEVNGVQYVLLRDQEGIRVYRGTDRRTVLALMQNGEEYRQAVITTKVSDRWIFNAGDLGQVGIRVTRLVQRALKTP